MKVLLIDDDVRFRGSVARVLASVGWVVDEIELARIARTHVDIEDVDVVAVDVSCLKEADVALLGRLRAHAADVPMLAVGATDAASARNAASSAGADSYLAKPFAIDELVVRISALLEQRLGGGRLRLGNLVRDVIGRRVLVDDRPLSLTRSHLSLLECLMRRPGEAVPYHRIAQAVYGVPSVPPNSVQRHVSELRRRLSRAGASATIVAQRRQGYACTSSAGRDRARPQ